MEINGSEGIEKTYIYANSQIITQHAGSHTAARYFYLHDRLGSVRQMIDTSGNVVKLYTYEPFGEVLETDGTLDNGFMFIGQFYDSEINEYYLRARMYNPHIHRFTTRDPIAGKFEEPLTLQATCR
jgi:RHS repeat-associated protein